MHRRFQTALARASAIVGGSLLLLATAPFSRAQGFVSSDLSKLRSVGTVALSPDGHHVAYTVTMRDEPRRPYGQLWVMDLATQKSIRFGGDKDRGGGPLWSPDGKWIAFFGRQGDKHGLMIARPDGSEFTVLATPDGTDSPLPGIGNEVTWSPDGKDRKSTRLNSSHMSISYAVFCLKKKKKI